MANRIIDSSREQNAKSVAYLAPIQTKFVEDLSSETPIQQEEEVDAIKNAIITLKVPSSGLDSWSTLSPSAKPRATRRRPRPSSHTYPTPSPMPLARPVRLLIASLGNPQPYHSTRHSAGHILLRALASHLSFPPLTTRSKDHGNGFLSASGLHPEYTLWQSTSLMNVSGPGVGKAWRAFENNYGHDNDIVTGLVVLHDELESAPGSIKLRRGEGSAKGHNGIKSVQGSLAGMGVLKAFGNRFVKLGIGIGRPLSRDREDVSAYVLGQMTALEREKVESAAATLVEVLEQESSRMAGA